MATTTATNNTFNVKLSALWMADHLDVWEADCEAPEGTFKGKVWVGTITEAQGKEIISRCDIYKDTDGFEEEALKFCHSAQRVLKALRKQAPELFPRQPQMVIVETEDGIKITWE